jgi:hypothetical protein
LKTGTVARPHVSGERLGGWVRPEVQLLRAILLSRSKNEAR